MQSDELTIVTKIQRQLKESYQQIADVMIAGGVDNMEKYNYMLGQIRTYQYIIQEISSLLKQKEQNDKEGTIIKINRDS